MTNIAPKEKTLVLLVGAVVAAAELQAKTVCWYHFDECEPGTVTTESSVVVDAAGTQNGAPEYWWNNGKTTNANYMPAYSNAFPVGRHWVDPKTGVKGTLNRCLQLVNPDIRYEWGNGEHGVVKIPDNEAFHLQTLTIECFVKDLYSVDDIAAGQGSRFVLSKKNSWSMAIPAGTGNGSRALNGSVSYDQDGASTSWSNGMNLNCLPRALRDGNWHHLAIVIDGRDISEVKVSYYQDYHLLRTSGTMQGPVFYDDSPIFLGRQDGIANYGWNGLIDELRISDEALDPEEFLRFANDVADADTVAFYSFDKWFGNPFEMSPAWGEFSNYFVNETPFVNPPKATLTPRESATIPFLTDENAGTVRNGLVSPTAVADLGSISAVTNGYGQAFGFTIDTTTPEQLYMAGDFTAEGFVKLNSLPDSTDYLMRGLLTQGGVDNTWLVTVGSNGKLNFSINWQKNVSTPTSVVSDFGWHHVAVVSTPATMTTRFYVDYRLVDTIADGEHYVLADVGTTTRLILFSYSENGQGNFCLSDAYASDFRITRRALDPQEFLTTRPIDATLVAAARFEGDFTVGPYFAPVPDGVPSAGVSFATKVPAKTIVDGNGGTVAETNAKSVWLAGGTVDFGRNMPLENADEMTVEFFLRPEVVAEGGAEVMKLAATDGTVWAIRLSADRKTLSLVADTAAEVGQVLEFPVDLGPRWNHLAFTFAKLDGKTLVTAYRNGSSPVKRTLTGTLKTDGKSSFTLGSEGLSAYVDELRVSPTVLAPAAFMVCPDAPGMVLVFK